MLEIDYPRCGGLDVETFQSASCSSRKAQKDGNWSGLAGHFPPCSHTFGSRFSCRLPSARALLPSPRLSPSHCEGHIHLQHHDA